MFLTSDLGNKLLNEYVETLLHSVHTLGPGLSNLQKVDNLATRVNLLTTFATLIPNAGPRLLQKGPGEGVIYLQISEMSNSRSFDKMRLDPRYG